MTFRNRSASGRCAGFALAGLLVLPAQGRAATASETLDSCAERITRSPYDYDAHVCVFRVAQSGDARAEAEAYLERLGTPLADVVRGFIIQARDETLAASLYVRGADGLERARKSSGGETTEGEIAARSNLATILKRRGDVAGARRQVEIAAEATRTNSSPKVRGRALLLEANFLVDTGGDLARVEANLLEAEPLFFPGGAYTQRRALVRDRANLRFSQGRFEAAAQDYRRMLAMASAENDLVGSMVATFNLAFTLWTLAEEHPTAERSGIASAAILARQARDRAIAASDPLFAHRAIELEAHIARAQKRPSEARDLYVDALARLAELGHPEKIATSALALADLRAAEHSTGGPIAPDLARSLAEADVAFEAVSNPRYRTSLWPWRLHALWRVEPEALAIPQSFAALDSIEALRTAQSDESNRIAVQSTWARDYRWVAGRLLERFATRSEEAFAAMERLRARALRESLTASRIGAIEAAADVPVATLAEARAALTPDELLVSFQIDDDRDVFGESAGGSWALALTRDKARVFRLADRAELEAFTAGLLAVLELPELVGPVAQRLGLSLFGAPLADIGPGIRRLLIVPDGVLHQIPFEALALGADGGESLGLRFEIAVLPSASYLVEARRSSTPPPGARALLVADPVLPAVANEVSATARTEERGRLPYARREVRSIARRFGRDSQILEGDVATETAFTGALSANNGDVALVHLATHAIVEPGDPARSAVLLATDSVADGRLEPAEIARLDLRGRLVVLSACRSAAGDVAAGEGPLSLARAFLKAGASAVVASRWPLRDDEAAEFFEAFHDRWSRGATAADAAREARRSRARAGSPVMLWAGVTLIGDPEARLATPATPTRSGLAVWLALATILIVVLASRRARSRRQATGR